MGGLVKADMGDEYLIVIAGPCYTIQSKGGILWGKCCRGERVCCRVNRDGLGGLEPGKFSFFDFEFASIYFTLSGKSV